MTCHFRFKNAEGELDVSGERAFVEAQIEKWLPRLSGAAPSAPAEAIPRVSAAFKPQLNISLADLVAMKQAVSPADLLVVTAYYLEKYLQRGAYSLSDLRCELEGLEAWARHEIDDALQLAMVQGLMEEVRDGYTLTYKGQNYVREGLAL